MLHITSGKDNIVFKRKKMNLVHLNEKIRLEKIRGGGLRFLAGCTQEGGGGFIQMRTVCNRGGGGSKNWEKMRM